MTYDDSRLDYHQGVQKHKHHQIHSIHMLRPYAKGIVNHHQQDNYGGRRHGQDHYPTR